MAKRTFLQLGQPINFAKHDIGGAYMSEKYDGMRAFWDGGVTAGLAASDVPWANTTKDHIRVKPPIATGLWSRYGNVITAPASFTTQLPPFPLDGELWLGPQKFQDITSICRTLEPDSRWTQVKFMVLDIVAPHVVFADGLIDETNFKKQFTGCLNWYGNLVDQLNLPPLRAYYDFHHAHSWMVHNVKQNAVVYLARQERLPLQTTKARERVEEFLTEVLARGGEGVIVRNPSSPWIAERTHSVRKYKPAEDAEAIVTGYIWGRETDKGSKLLGLMGAMILDFNGKRLELSGFTDAERVMCYTGRQDGEEHARTSGEAHPGQEVDPAFENRAFPRGSRVTIKYRELTRDGIPKEARFFRKRMDL